MYHRGLQLIADEVLELAAVLVQGVGHLIEGKLPVLDDGGVDLDL